MGDGLAVGLGEGLGVAGVAVVLVAVCEVGDAAGVVGAVVGVDAVVVSDVPAVAVVADGC